MAEANTRSADSFEKLLACSPTSSPSDRVIGGALVTTIRSREERVVPCL